MQHKNELLQELAVLLVLPPREPGDIDANDLAQLINRTTRRCRDIMHNLAKDYPDVWKLMKVEDGGSGIMILRQIGEMTDEIRQNLVNKRDHIRTR